MKKTFILAIAPGVFLTGNVKGGNVDLFSYDRKQIQSEMAWLDTLERMVLENPGTAPFEIYRRMQAEPENYTLTGQPLLPFDLGSLELGMPGYYLGCIPSLLGYASIYYLGLEGALILGVAGGLAGILITYLASSNKTETEQAIYGCLTSSILMAGFLVAQIVLGGVL